MKQMQTPSGFIRTAGAEVLTAQEQVPVIVLHVDVENSMVSSSRYSKDVVSALSGDLLDASAKAFASHVLAEAAWGTINAETGSWAPGLEAGRETEEGGLTFGEYLRLRYKTSARQTADVEEVKRRLHDFGNDVKPKRRNRRASAGAGRDAADAAASALREGHKALLRRLMLPPTVCMALGCEEPDVNRVLGRYDDATVRSRLTSGSAAPEPTQNEKDKEELGKPTQLPLQLKAGYWQMTPAFLTLMFGLTRARRAFRIVFHARSHLGSAAAGAILQEYNMLCEGRHPAFDGENRTKQVFLDGTHGSPDFRILEDAIAVMRAPVSLGSRNPAQQTKCFSHNMEITLEIPSADRCYKGVQEIYAGIMYHELEEKKALFIFHEPQRCLRSLNTEQILSAGDACKLLANAELHAEGHRASTSSPALVTQAELPLSHPLTVLVDGQDLERFHVCLSSPGILTLIDGLSYIPTILPIDVVTHQPLNLQPGEWPKSTERDTSSSQSFGSPHFSRGSGVLEFGAAACRVSPSQWDLLMNSDCLVAAVACCEEKRKQLATMTHGIAEADVTLSQSAAVDAELQLPKEAGGALFGTEQGSTLFEPFGFLANTKGIPSQYPGLSAPDISYLMQSVVPVLYPALEVVVRDRPEDPLAAIAFYLLKNAKGYSRTSNLFQTTARPLAAASPT